MARASNSSGSSGPYRAATRQQLAGHDALLRWAIGVDGVGLALAELRKQHWLAAAFKSALPSLRKEIEGDLDALESDARQAQIWRQIPELTFGKCVESFDFQFNPGVAQYSEHSVTKQVWGGREEVAEYRPLTVCDATIQVRARAKPEFHLVRNPTYVGSKRTYEHIKSPIDGLRSFYRHWDGQVVVNCYPEESPLTMMGNDLALLSSSCTEYKKRRNGSGNILFVVEDEEAYDFLRRSCNVILHDCGGIAAEELSFFDQWISSKGDEVEVTDLDLADALIPEEGSDTSGKATRRTRRTKS